jgi:hypothetical protein
MAINRIEAFVKVCQKLDELRFAGTINWGPLGENIHKNDKLNASTRLLLFWLCSMVDQFYGYIRIWTLGEKAMLRLLEGNPKSFSDVNTKIRDEREIYISARKKFVLVRDDYLRIKNTFDFLTRYSTIEEEIAMKFVRFLGELISKNQGKGGLLRFAFFLDRGPWGNSPLQKLNEQALTAFKKKQRKRLWMFLMFLRRDPAVLKLFEKALIECYGKYGEELFKIWRDPQKFDPMELELPSDMWNKRLFNALIGKTFILKRKGAKRVARDLAAKYTLSPSIFDVTFEIGANKCKQRECTQCPFGDNEICHKGKEKYCSVSNWLFPYYVKDKDKLICNSESCPIGRDFGKDLCTRDISKEIKH